MSKKDELLAVLDMTEIQQAVWLAKEAYISCPLTAKEFGSKTDDWRWETWAEHNIATIRISLANLAFIMRDEAVKKDITKYIDAENMVKAYVLIMTRYALNWSYDAQPIHWIIAALVAQEQRK